MVRQYLFVALFLSFFHSIFSQADPPKKKLGMFSSKLIPKEGYNEDEPPNGQNDPKLLDLEVKLKILAFNDFQESLNSLKISILLTSSWIESRVDTSPFLGMQSEAFIPRNEQKMYWRPYFLFFDIKGGELLDNQLKYPWYTIEPKNKRATYRQYFDLNVECKMEMRHYPLDVQRCTLDLRTFQPEEFGKWINIKWVDELEDEMTPISVFSFSLVRLERSIITNVTRPLLRVSFSFERQVLPQLVTLYMPSSLIVCCTFISFWVRTSAVPARVALVITALLAMLQLMVTGRKNLPPVSYVTALDVWLFVCVFYVFAALFEFAIAYNMDLQTKDVKRMSSVWYPSTMAPKETLKDKLLRIFYSTHLDIWSRMCFPLSFLIFIAAYFAYYGT